MEPSENQWHELPEADVLRMLESQQVHGLTRAEVEARIRQFGTNEKRDPTIITSWDVLKARRPR